MKAENFAQAMGQIDDKYYVEADIYQPLRSRKRILKWGIIAACLCLLAASAAAIASGKLGTRLIETFSHRQIASDYKESGFRLGVDLERVPMKELSEEVLQAGQIIRQQYKDQTLYDNRLPCDWQSPFPSRADACKMIGFDAIRTNCWDWPEQATTLHIYGDEKGQVLNLNLETDYTVNEIRMQFFTRLYTEKYTDAIVIGAQTTEDVAFTESIFTASNDISCHVVASSRLESGFMCMDGYITDQNVLYHLHIAYPEENETQATALLHQWVEGF